MSPLSSNRRACTQLLRGMSSPSRTVSNISAAASKFPILWYRIAASSAGAQSVDRRFDTRSGSMDERRSLPPSNRVSMSLTSTAEFTEPLEASTSSATASAGLPLFPSANLADPAPESLLHIAKSEELWNTGPEPIGSDMRDSVDKSRQGADAGSGNFPLRPFASSYGPRGPMRAAGERYGGTYIMIIYQ